MSDSTTSSIPPIANSPIQQVPSSVPVLVEPLDPLAPTEVTAAAAPVDGSPGTGPGAFNDEWGARFSNCLWQLGLSAPLVAVIVDQLATSGLTQAELETDYTQLTKELALRDTTSAWIPGSQIGQIGQVGQHGPTVPTWTSPGQPPAGQYPPGIPGTPGAPGKPPTGGGTNPDPKPPSGQTPPPGSGAPGAPGKPPSGFPGQPAPGKPGQGTPGPVDPVPTDPIPTDPGQGGGDHDGGGSLAPWLIGAGVLGAIGIGAAIIVGARSSRGLTALTKAYESGNLTQGGMHAILDAQQGARFARGITTSDHLRVTMPFVNRIGENAELRSVALGHLDNLEFNATMAAMYTPKAAAETATKVASKVATAGDAQVVIDNVTRKTVLAGIERGDSLKDVLKPFQRSADGRKVAFSDARLMDMWQENSILERGTSMTGKHVLSGATAELPELAIVDRKIVETGVRNLDVNKITVRRGADLDGRGLAEMLGETQGLRVSRNNPGLQAEDLATAKVDPELAKREGLPAAFTARWRERLG